MAKNDRSSFNIQSNETKPFNTLIKNKKKVEISGENNFTNDAFSNIPKDQPTVRHPTKRGRPTVIHDKRYQVIKPKKISPALESKLDVMKDYITELQTVQGRVTFEKLVDTLAEAYITRNLSVSKRELLQSEIKRAFQEIK